MSLLLDDYQVDALLHPVAGARVSRKRNERGQDVSHLEAYDIRRRLTEIFGFGGWSGEVLEMRFMYEGPVEIGENKRDGYEVGYACTYRLTVHGKDGTSAVYTETAFGDAKMGVTNRGAIYDFAIKTAESQALKRCAINLGNQFGLSLYNKGSVAPLVKFVLGHDPAKWTIEGIIRPKRERDEKDAEEGVERERGDHGLDVSDHVTEQLAPDPESAETPAEPGDASPPAPASQDQVPGQTEIDVPGGQPPLEGSVPLVQDALSAAVDVVVADKQAGRCTKQEANQRLRSLLLDAGKAQVLQADVGGRSLEAKITDARHLVK